MKGYTHIELINTKTGEVKDLGKHNLVTNAYLNLLTPNFDMIPNNNRNYEIYADFYRWLPLFEQVFGGIEVCGGDIEADPDNMVIKKDWYKTHVGSSDKWLTQHYERDETHGYLDTNESEFNLHDVKLVYKFSEEVCNDKLIQTICLTPKGICGFVLNKEVPIELNYFLKTQFANTFMKEDRYGWSSNQLSRAGYMVGLDDDKNYYFIQANTTTNKVKLTKYKRNEVVGIGYKVEVQNQYMEDSENYEKLSEVETTSLYDVAPSSRWALEGDNLRCAIIDSSSSTFTTSIPVKVLTTSLSNFENTRISAMSFNIPITSSFTVKDIKIVNNDVVINSSDKVIIHSINHSTNTTLEMPESDLKVVKFLDTISLLDISDIESVQGHIIPEKFIYILGDDNEWYCQSMILPSSAYGSQYDWKNLGYIEEVVSYPSAYNEPYCLIKTIDGDTARNMIGVAPFVSTINNLGRNNAFIKTNEEVLKITYILQDY